MAFVLGAAASASVWCVVDSAVSPKGSLRAGASRLARWGDINTESEAEDTTENNESEAGSPKFEPSQFERKVSAPHLLQKCSVEGWKFAPRVSKLHRRRRRAFTGNTTDEVDVESAIDMKCPANGHDAFHGAIRRWTIVAPTFVPPQMRRMSSLSPPDLRRMSS